MTKFRGQCNPRGLRRSRRRPKLGLGLEGRMCWVAGRAGSGQGDTWPAQGQQGRWCDLKCAVPWPHCGGQSCSGQTLSRSDVQPGWPKGPEQMQMLTLLYRGSARHCAHQIGKIKEHTQSDIINLVSRAICPRLSQMPATHPHHALFPQSFATNCSMCAQTQKERRGGRVPLRKPPEPPRAGNADLPAPSKWCLT